MSEKRRLLLVDDDPDIVLGTQLRLKALGYDVSTAPDGRQALESATKDPPDAILLDVRMPGMDGLSALAKLRQCESTKAVPVVMLSASLLDRHKALDLGARYFVDKPYDTKVLVDALHSAMARGFTPRGIHDDATQTCADRR